MTLEKCRRMERRAEGTEAELTVPVALTGDGITTARKVSVLMEITGLVTCRGAVIMEAVVLMGPVVLLTGAEVTELTIVAELEQLLTEQTPVEEDPTDEISEAVGE